MKKIKENGFNLILIALLIVLCFAILKQFNIAIGFAKTMKEVKFAFPFVNKEITNDTFFTIAMGNNILQNGIQKSEILTWHEGLNFSNPRWLYDVFIATLYNHVGIDGIYIYTVIMAIITLGLVFFVSYKMCKNWKLSLAYTLFTWYLCQYSFYARAWQFSFIFIILEYYFIQKIIETGKLRYSVFIVVMTILLVNIHASVFMIYLLMFLPYIVEQLMYIARYKIPKIEIEEVKHFKQLMITLGVTLIVAFINPFGALPYVYIFKNMSGFSTVFIGELSPTTFSNNKLFYTILLVLILLMVNGKQKIKVVDIFYIAGFAVLTMGAYRSFYYFVYISGMCIVRIINDFFKYNDWKINKCLVIANTVLMCLLFIIVMSINFIRTSQNELVPKQYYPVELSDYILENVDASKMKLYNDFNYGSYLEFRGIKTFVDSRSEVFCEEFNPGCTVLKDWYWTSMGKKDYSECFDKYGITHVAIQTSSDLSSKLQEDENWKIIYSDIFWNLYENVKKEALD
ncbi:MAG: hypothetical protein J6A36_00425 [Clostridia bacterium]|nr:hypothetical protein [Clostridia bacterium]